MQKVGILNKSATPDVLQDGHVTLANQSAARPELRKKEPGAGVGKQERGVLQDKTTSGGPKQAQVLNKSKSEPTPNTVNQVNKQLFPGQQLKRTGNHVNENSLHQQPLSEQQQNKQLLEKKQLGAVTAVKDIKPVVPAKKPAVGGGLRGKELSRHIPPFYFPMGQPPVSASESETILQQIKDAFSGIEGGKANRLQMGVVAKVRFSRVSFAV